MLYIIAAALNVALKESHHYMVLFCESDCYHGPHCLSLCSCLAACEGRNVHILEIDGQRFMPSYAAFTEATYLVGREAKEQAKLL